MVSKPVIGLSTFSGMDSEMLYRRSEMVLARYSANAHDTPGDVSTFFASQPQKRIKENEKMRGIDDFIGLTQIKKVCSCSD